MKKDASTGTGGLSPRYQNYEHQKCFIGLSNGARWHDEIENICDKVLPSFELEPWYADHHFDPTKPLLDIVVEMIANARYGIYDLSYWRKDDKSEWVMPRNVFIELGIAIALNRPTLLLQHEESRRDGPGLPEYLEGIRENILPFTGDYTLRRALEDHLPQWVNAPPDQEWHNRYCHFGNRTCTYREVHPRRRHWVQGPLPCHISYGPDRDQVDFRNVIENILQGYNDVQADYLHELVPADGYEFLLCMHCQKVRATPFAIYRITPQTTGETFIAIGISIALEKQFDYKIPRILLAEKMEDVPSLLKGTQIVLAKNNLERKRRLQEFLPQVYQIVRKTTWRSRPLPFIEVVPRRVEKPLINQKSSEEAAADEATLHNQRGNTLYAEQRYDEALMAYEQATQIAPNIAYYLYNKGLALHQLNRYQEAMTAYEQATQIAPEYAPVYAERGRIYATLKEYQLALQNIERALELDASLEWVRTLREEVVRTLREHNTHAQGEMLAARYQLLEPIGRGGMATIYRGQDTRMDRIVAIKVLREVYSTDPKFVSRFQHEAKTASSLQHSNIVQVYDYGQSDGNYFIVMELIEGTDLRRDLRSRGVLAADRAIIIAHDVALGLGAAHSRGIVHHDVKPQNILVGRDGSIKLTDFGIASIYKDMNAERQRLATTGMTLGNVQYLAPEQAQDEVVSSAADVYSLGIVMYEMLTGRTPFDKDASVALAIQHIQDAPTPPSKLNPGIPPALEEIILRCLEKAPKKRFRDGSALARGLELLGKETSAVISSAGVTLSTERSSQQSDEIIWSLPDSPKKFILYVQEGKEPGRVYEVRKKNLGIGRTRGSDIFLEDLAVSRLHASIIMTDNGNYALKDEGSANGTRLNGEPVNKYQYYALKDGDRIQLGQTIFVFGEG